VSYSTAILSRETSLQSTSPRQLQNENVKSNKLAIQNKATKQPYKALKSTYTILETVRGIADQNKVKQQIQLLRQSIAAASDDADRSFLRFKSTICEEELHFLEIKQPFDVVDEDLSQLMAILRKAPNQKLYLICESAQLLVRDFRKNRKVIKTFLRLRTRRNDRLFRQKVISASIPSIMFADSINDCAPAIDLLEASTRGTAVV
jgi:hypothetical protein